MPGFAPTPGGRVDPIEYWSRNNLFEGGRIQGIVGNANLLGPLCLLAIIVFAIRLAAGAPRRALLCGWIGLSRLPDGPRRIRDRVRRGGCASGSSWRRCC